MASPLNVVDRDGLRGVVDSAGSTDPAKQMKVRWENGHETMIPPGSLTAQPDGTYFLPFAYSDQNATATPGSLVVPVFEERLDIGKRVVETGGGVRVHKVVHEHEEIIDQPLLLQEVDVQRVPVGRVVDGPIAIRHVGDTMIVPVLEERLIIQKQLILKEEIHITKRQLSNRQPQRVTVRKEEAKIERLPGTRQQGETVLDSAAPTPSEPVPGSILDRVFPPEAREPRKVRTKKGD